MSKEYVVHTSNTSLHLKLLPIMGAISVLCVLLVFCKVSQLSQRKVMIGVWSGGLWDDQSKQLDVNQVIQFEKNIRKKVAIAHYFKGWDQLDDPGLVKELNSLSDNGWVPMLSANPYHSSKCMGKVNNIYAEIATGNCDVLIRKIAQLFRSYGKPVFFRFAWEMNIDTISWSIQSTYSTPEDYVAAWRHIHTIFDEEKTNNVIWVFSVNVETANSIPIERLYPGDEYVDWIGIDGYNWGDAKSWSHWSSFDEVFHATYQKILVMAPLKPVMISEFNSVERGGDKAAWMQEALGSQIPKNYPQVQALIFFNENKMEKEGVDWRIERSAAVMKVIQKNLARSLYSSTLSKKTAQRDE